MSLSDCRRIADFNKSLSATAVSFVQRIFRYDAEIKFDIIRYHWIVSKMAGFTTGAELTAIDLGLAGSKIFLEVSWVLHLVYPVGSSESRVN